MCIRNDARRVLEELSQVFDEWELADWLTDPNTWLDGRIHVDSLALDADRVVAAARTDCFIAAGS